MLGPKPPEKFVHNFVIISQTLGLLLAQIDEHSRIHASNAVEYRFSQIHFPLIFPWCKYILHLGLGVDDTIIAHLFLTFSYFFLVHGEDVESLVEFNSFAESDVLSVVAIDHRQYFIIKANNKPHR